MVFNVDFVRFQVSCILGMEVAWYEHLWSRSPGMASRKLRAFS